MLCNSTGADRQVQWATVLSSDEGVVPVEVDVSRLGVTACGNINGFLSASLSTTLWHEGVPQRTVQRELGTTYLSPHAVRFNRAGMVAHACSAAVLRCV